MLASFDRQVLLWSQPWLAASCGSCFVAKELPPSGFPALLLIWTVTRQLLTMPTGPSGGCMTTVSASDFSKIGSTSSPLTYPFCMKDAEDRDSGGGGMHHIRCNNKIVGGVPQGRIGADGIREEARCSISCFSWVPCRGNTILIVHGNEMEGERGSFVATKLLMQEELLFFPCMSSLGDLFSNLQYWLIRVSSHC
jgi:hypothetical protein